MRDDSRDREEESQEDEIPEEEVELEGESVDTVTGEPREHRREAAVDVAPEVPGGSPEVASGVDFSATEDSIARQATEEATEHSASVEPESRREKARELRPRSARPTASKPSPSVSEEPVEERPPVEKRVKPPPQATSAKAKTRKESSEPGDVGRDKSAVGALRRAIGRDPSRQREGEGSSGSGLKHAVEELPAPPPVPTKEEIEQAEAARQRELQSLPPPPPVPREPPVPATTRAASKPRLTEEIQPVVLAPRPKERPQPVAPAEPSTSARPTEPARPPSSVWQDKPLILFDWHKTLSFPHQPVHESAIQLLRRLQSEGYALGVLSFASARETQELVLSGVEGVNTRLDRPFDVVAITRTKFIKDHVQSPSITGHTGPKAQLVTEFGALVFVDDQAALLSDVRSWQHNLPQGGRTHLVRSGVTPVEALVPLERVLREFPRAGELPSAR